MAWEPWTGCYAESEGCRYCYYYGPYSKRNGQNAVVKTDEFYKPVETVFMPRKNITRYKLEGGKTVATCFTTDFFIPEADGWRAEAWSMIRRRPDLTFLMLTKRIGRFYISLPDDWGEGYENVRIGCTVENREAAELRLPFYLSCPIIDRWIVCSPLLSGIDLSPYLHGVVGVRVCGESGRDARVCDYAWVTEIREQCAKAAISFVFDGTGSHFRKDGVTHNINPYKQKSTARDMGIDLK